MRVTPQVQTTRAVMTLQRHNLELLKYQTQVSTGKRVIRPSDDPADASLITRNRADDFRLEGLISNIVESSSVLESSVDAMLEVRDIITQVKVLTLEANSSGNIATNERQANEALATELDELIDQLISVANRKLADGRYLFGGTATETKPFEVVTDEKQRPQTVTYQGTSEDVEAIVGKSLTVETFLAGNRVFQPATRKDTVYLNNTGAQAGESVDTLDGTGTLYVGSAGATVIDFASGLFNGTSPDTLNNGVHRLTISSGGAAISLNGGPTVIHNGGTDVAVTGPGTSGGPPPPNVTIFINASGTLADGEYVVTRGDVLSLNGNGSIVNGGTKNEVVTDSASGEIVYVDATNIQRAGKDRLVAPGSADLFQTLMTLRDDMRDPSFSNADRSNVLSLHLVEIDRIGGAILETVGQQSAKSKSLVTLKNRTEDVQLEVKQFTNNLESADAAEAILNLQSNENLFQIGLAVAARVNTISLVNFLN